MNLLRAELRRLTKRRITRWMLVLVLLLMPTVAIIAAANHVKPGPAAVAEAEATAERFLREQEQWIEQDIARCEEDKEQGNTDIDWPENCQEIGALWYGVGDQADLIESFMPPAFDFREDFPPMILVLTALLALFGFIVGASYVGAEWRTGGMMNLLLWRPRRLEVLGTKFGAVLGSLTALTVLLGAAWTGMFWLVAEFRGVTDTMTPGAWQSFGLSGLRGLALVLLAGTVGFGLASIGRHTAMAMGSAIAAFVVGVAGVGIIGGGMLQLPYFERWMWTTYITAWMDKSVVLSDWNAPCIPQPNGDCLQPTIELTWQHAGIGMTALLAVVLVVTMWQMRQRDVT
jgi:ABC-2 type transport system permease protein